MNIKPPHRWIVVVSAGALGALTLAGAALFRLPVTVAVIPLIPALLASVWYPNRIYLAALLVSVPFVTFVVALGTRNAIDNTSNQLLMLALTFGMCELLFNAVGHRLGRAQGVAPKDQESFAQIFQALAFPVAISRRSDGTIIDVNHSYEKMVGYSRDQILGKTSLDIGVWANADARAKPLEQLQRDGFVDNYFNLVKTGTGKSIATLVSWRPIEFEGEQCILTEVIDVTERQSAEAALRESEDLYRSLFDAMPVGVGLADSDGTLRLFNEAILAPGGFSREDMLKIGNVARLYADAEERRTVLEEAAKQGFIHRREVRFKRKDGTPYNTLLSLRRVNYRGSEGWQAVVEDITERKHAEQALRDSEARYRLLVENAPTFVALLNLDLAYTFINRFPDGSDPRPKLGKTLEDVYLDDAAFVRMACEDVLRTSEPRQFETSMIMPHDNRRHWFFNQAVPVLDGGKPSGLQIIGQDITDRRESERQIEDLLVAEQAARRTAEALHATGAALSRSLELETILETLLDHLRALIPYDSANAMIVDSQGVLHLHALHGYTGDEEAVSQLAFKLDETPILQEVFSPRSVLISDVTSRSDWITHEASRYIRSWMGIPLVAGGEVIGLFSIDKKEAGYFTDEHLRLAEAVSAQAAVAVKNARLVESERQQLKLAQTLQQVGALLTSEISLDDLFERLFDLLKDVLPYDSASIQLANDDGSLHFTAGRGFPDFRLVQSSSEELDIDWNVITSLDSQSSGTVLINDVKQVEGWITIPGTEHTRTWIGVALRVKNRLVGVMNVDNAQPFAYDEQAIATITAFANQAAIAIENKRLSDSTVRRNQYLTALRRVSNRAVPERNRDNFLQAVAEALAEEFDYPIVTILLANDSTREMETVAIAGRFSTRLRVNQVISRQSYDEGIFGAVILSGQAQLVKNANATNLVAGPDLSVERCVLAVPIRHGAKNLGVVSVSTTEPEGLDELDEEALIELATELALNLENLELYESQVSVAHENAKLYRSADERSSRLAVLNQVTRVSVMTIDLNAMLQQVTEELAGLTSSDEVRISLWDPRREQTIPIADNTRADARNDLLNFPPGERTLTMSALETGGPIVVEDVFNSPYVSAEIAARFGNASALAVPLMEGAQPLGALVISFKQRHAFSSDEVDWVSQAGELVALAIAKSRAYSLLEERVDERTAELRAANLRLMEMSRLKDEFVSNVSHELRTPISSIKLYHHLLEARPEKKVEYLSRLDRETRRLERIIEDMLMLSRLDQERTTISKERVDVTSLAHQYVEDREALAEERGLRLTSAKPKTPIPNIEADPTLLGQALSVILTNAINYTPPGGKIKITTASRRKQGKRWVTISVSDTGPGISDTDQSRLFQRFFRGTVGAQSGAPGTGLGLAIAHGIVTEHGGHIEVDSSGKENQGAIFTIWMPVVDGSGGESGDRTQPGVFDETHIG